MMIFLETIQGRIKEEGEMTITRGGRWGGRRTQTTWKPEEK